MLSQSPPSFDSLGGKSAPRAGPSTYRGSLGYQFHMQVFRLARTHNTPIEKPDVPSLGYPVGLAARKRRLLVKKSTDRQEIMSVMLLSRCRNKFVSTVPSQTYPTVSRIDYTEWRWWDILGGTMMFTYYPTLKICLRSRKALTSEQVYFLWWQGNILVTFISVHDTLNGISKPWKRVYYWSQMSCSHARSHSTPVQARYIRRRWYQSKQNIRCRVLRMSDD